jgi:hypothetical protein
MDWIFSKYAVERNDEVKLLLMKAMAETLRLEEEMPKLEDFSVVSIFLMKFCIIFCIRYIISKHTFPLQVYSHDCNV